MMEGSANELARTLDPANAVWPERMIERIEEVPNTFDDYGSAATFTLECGHQCTLTGHARFDRVFIRCKACAESAPQ